MASNRKHGLSVVPDANRASARKRDEHELDSSPYVRDRAGARFLSENGPLDGRGLPRKCGNYRSDPAVLINDLLEIAECPYVSYADGMTRRGKCQGTGAVESAVGRELRPGFVAFLIRRLEQNDEEMAGHVVASILDAMRADGPEPRKWAAALALRLGGGLSQTEIARDMGVEQQTVSRYLHCADEWMRDHIAQQGWIQAYLYDHETGAAARYHVDADAAYMDEIARVMAGHAATDNGQEAG